MRSGTRSVAQWTLALVTIGFLAASSPGILAGGVPSNRTETWEFTLPIRYLTSEHLEFDGGSTVDLHSDIGFGFGFGYNFDEHMNLNFEFSWTDANYTADIVSGDFPPDPTFSASGSMDASSSTFNFTYNFLPKTITPYISAGLGWTWIDTNIPTSPPQTGCWWDPWYGYICTTYQSTATESGFNYGLGAGVRIEPKDSFFLRFGVNDNWQDFGNYSDTPDILSYRLELGWKF